jgi:hypothetical protein
VDGRRKRFLRSAGRNDLAFRIADGRWRSDGAGVGNAGVGNAIVGNDDEERLPHSRPAVERRVRLRVAIARDAVCNAGASGRNAVVSFNHRVVTPRSFVGLAAAPSVSGSLDWWEDLRLSIQSGTGGAGVSAEGRWR